MTAAEFNNNEKCRDLIKLKLNEVCGITPQEDTSLNNSGDHMFDFTLTSYLSNVPNENGQRHLRLAVSNTTLGLTKQFLLDENGQRDVQPLSLNTSPTSS